MTNTEKIDYLTKKMKGMSTKFNNIKKKFDALEAAYEHTEKICVEVIDDVGHLPVYPQLLGQGTVYREVGYVGRKTIGK